MKAVLHNMQLSPEASHALVHVVMQIVNLDMAELGLKCDGNRTNALPF
jgi:hypothetical protein